MGRPTKEDMPYFSHDSNARADQKMRRFIPYVGMAGYGLYFAVLEDIYSNSYYTEWTDQDADNFVREFKNPRFPVSREDLDYIIEQALYWELFSQEKFDEHGILTSRSVQERWLKQSSRRIVAEMRVDYLLINPEMFYKKELENATLSIKIVDSEGITQAIYGDYEETGNGNGVSGSSKAVDGDNNVDNSEDQYEEKYDFSRDYRWDGEQPIDYAGCVETFNKITGGQLRVTKSKRVDLRRAFREYTGLDCYYGMMCRAQNENMKNSKYLTDWSTLFGHKKLEKLDKWVVRGREWREEHRKMESVEEHLKNGWMSQSDYRELCKKAGVEFEDPTFCETKKVDSQLLYYPQFSH